MNQSPEIDKIAPAIVDAQAEGLVVVAANKNSQTNSQYADLADIAAAVLPVLTRHGIAVLQFVGSIRSEQTMVNVGQDKKPGDMLVVGVTTRIQHVSGQWIEQAGEFPLAPPPVSKSGNEILNWSQNYGLTLTYARRYALVAALGIAVGDDRDAQNLQSALRDTGDSQVPKYQTHWSDLAGKQWDSAEIPGYKMTLGEMSPDEKRVVINTPDLKDLPAVTACLWDRTVDLMLEKNLKYKDAPYNLPTDYFDMTPKEVRTVYSWAMTAEAASSNGEVQA